LLRNIASGLRSLFRGQQFDLELDASVQALDECGFDQEITAGAPLLRPGDLQQKAGNRPDVRTTLLGACRDRKYTLCPDFAATNLTKELCQVGCRRAADWGELVRICAGTQKVSDDLDGLILKQGGFRTSVNNGPRKPCACGQAHMPLRPHRLHRFGWDLSCSPQSQFALLRCTT